MKITELFESIKSSEYPKELPDDWAIAEYAASVSSEDVSTEFVREQYRNCKATLRLLNVSSLKPGSSAHNIPSAKLQKQYMGMDPETMPPILVEHNTVVDGNHRFRVALAKGLKQIWAYVITSTEEPF